MSTSAKVIYIAIFNLILGIQLSHAQKIVVNNRDEFSVGVAYCMPVGSKYIEGRPTVLSNMRPGISVEASYLTSLSKNVRVGLSGSYTGFNGWSHSDRLFENSSLALTSFGPTLLYRTWSSTNPLFNKFNFFCGITPGLSRIKMVTNEDSEINSGSESIPLEVNSLNFYFSANAGMYYNVNNNIAIILSGGYQRAQVKSKVFTDRHYSSVSLRLGISIRIIKDKYYKLFN